MHLALMAKAGAASFCITCGISNQPGRIMRARFCGKASGQKQALPIKSSEKHHFMFALDGRSPCPCSTLRSRMQQAPMHDALGACLLMHSLF